MFNAKQDNKTATLLDTSIVALFGGIAVVSLFPAFFTIGSIMAVSGVLGVGGYFYGYSKFDRLWKNLNLGKGSSYPLLKSEIKNGKSTVYKFTIPAGLSVEDFDRCKVAIEQFLGREIVIKYTYKEIYIEAFENSSQTIYEYQEVECKGTVEFCVGYDRFAKPIKIDLSSEEPHMLIAGETGSGKSTVLRSIITNLILAGKVKLHLIDLKKGAEFQIFERCKTVVSFSRSRSEAENTLKMINSEVERRYDLFYENDVIDIKEYNKKIGKMGYEVVIIDEFADMQGEKDSISVLEEIAAKARACGIHLIISTQRPDAKVLNGRIKANVTVVLGLKTLNEINSRIIIDHEGLEKLKGKGHGILRKGKEIEIQCPLLTPDRARDILKHTYIAKKKNIIVEEVSEADILEVLR